MIIYQEGIKKCIKKEILINKSIVVDNARKEGEEFRFSRLGFYEIFMVCRKIGLCGERGYGGGWREIECCAAVRGVGNG